MTGDLKLICTDRGQHAPVTIQMFVRNFEGVSSPRRAEVFDGLEPISERKRTWKVTGRRQPVAGKSELYCRRCGRDPRLGADRLSLAINAVLETGRDTLDLSII